MSPGSSASYLFAQTQLYIFTMVNIRRIAFSLTALLPLTSAAPTTQQKRDVIPGKYIITLKEGVDSSSHLSWVKTVHRRSLTKRDTAGIEKTYSINTWNAYAGEFDDATLEQIKANDDVSTSGLLDYPVFCALTSVAG
jgi:oryzin